MASRPLKNAVSPFLVNRVFDGRIVEGDEILVQVVRDAQKSKRASVTAHISLANEYFAISFGSAKVGYSAKLNTKTKDAIRREFTEKAIIQNGFLIQLPLKQAILQARRPFLPFKAYFPLSR